MHFLTAIDFINYYFNIRDFMEHQNVTIHRKKISILVVDDSLVFRRFIGDIVEDCEDIEIVGEAENGIEALGMVLKTKPDVILLDVEMPLMDGMTALQHLMIHRPTPTIMFSSLTDEGTARCFDTMKNGAVDFICKDFIFHENNQQSHKKLLTDKVRRAARVITRAKEPVSAPSSDSKNNQMPDKQVVFCEECGQQEIVTLNKKSNSDNSVICTHCGDIIDLSLSAQKQFRRNTFITVIGGGEGSFANLLHIIPHLEPEMGGAIIVVIHAVTEHLNNFTEYLDAISEMEVIRARSGITIEGGNCYITSAQEYMSLKPYTAQLTLQKMQKKSSDEGAIDILLTSASIIMKKRLAGVILSGLENEGDRGIDTLIENEGVPVMLDPEECYCKQTSQRILAKCHIPETCSSLELVEKIKTLHYSAKVNMVAG